MDMPTSRYKVVEEGRRLVVIDRLTGERVKHQIHERPHRPDQNYEPPRAAVPAPMSARRRGTGAGTVFTTASWYDEKAPRALRLNDDSGMAIVIIGAVAVVLAIGALVFMGFVAWVVVGVILSQKGVRTAFRRGTTAWLDTLPPA